jgi:hypothetical protein
MAGTVCCLQEQIPNTKVLKKNPEKHTMQNAKFHKTQISSLV